jgi:hypothetical protein
LDSFDQCDAEVSASEAVLTDFAVSWAVVPGDWRIGCFKDDDALAGGSFEVLVGTVQSQDFDLAPGVEGLSREKIK